MDGQKKLHLINWETICQLRKQGGLGLRSAKDANLVAMSKLNWRLHTEERKVWREVLVKKYKISNPKAYLPSIGSPIIRNLSKGVDLFKKGIKWIPKNGQHISFWSDHWIGQAPLNSIFYGPFLPNTSCISLASVLHGGAVDMETVGYHLNSDIINAIKATPFSLINHLHDTFSWKGEANGLFSSASAHRILCSNSNVSSSDWGWVWKLPTLPKIKYFIWLLVHGKIKSMDFLHGLSIVQDPICKVCNNQVETLDHIFRGCPPAAAVLSRLLPGCLDMDHAMMDFGVWIKIQTSKMTPSSIHQIPWTIIFCFALWMIWKQRSYIIYRGSQMNVQAMSDMVVNSAVEFWASQPSPLGCNIKQPRLISWEPPPHDWIKLNTDGSVIGNPGMGSCGGLFRNSQGMWIIGYTCNIGHTTALAAELWAIRDDLQTAINLHFNSIIVETDCYVAYQLLSTAANLHHPHSTLIMDCRALLNVIPQVRLRHIFRESNMAADAIAKKGTHALAFVILYNCPADVELLYFADAIGVGYPRS
ncbi:hypothetical protein SLA2020_024380 [Shorea laevis]